MSDVFDLDAVEHEATGEPFRFKFGGREFTLPPSMDVRAVAMLTAGRLDDCLRLLMGEAQYEALVEVDAVFDTGKLRALFDEYARHTGVTLGNFGASPRSSKSTARPSKRTSRGTTKRR